MQQTANAHVLTSSLQVKGRYCQKNLILCLFSCAHIYREMHISVLDDCYSQCCCCELSLVGFLFHFFFISGPKIAWMHVVQKVFRFKCVWECEWRKCIFLNSYKKNVPKIRCIFDFFSLSVLLICFFNGQNFSCGPIWP